MVQFMSTWVNLVQFVSTWVNLVQIMSTWVYLGLPWSTWVYFGLVWSGKLYILCKNTDGYLGTGWTGLDGIYLRPLLRLEHLAVLIILRIYHGYGDGQSFLSCPAPLQKFFTNHDNSLQLCVLRIMISQIKSRARKREC